MNTVKAHQFSRMNHRGLPLRLDEVWDDNGFDHEVTRKVANPIISEITIRRDIASMEKSVGYGGKAVAGFYGHREYMDVDAVFSPKLQKAFSLHVGDSRGRTGALCKALTLFEFLPENDESFTIESLTKDRELHQEKGHKFFHQAIKHICQTGIPPHYEKSYFTFERQMAHYPHAYLDFDKIAMDTAWTLLRLEEDEGLVRLFDLSDRIYKSEKSL